MTATTSRGQSARAWRKRSDDLFNKVDAIKDLLQREAVRRTATAALNIAELMEHAAADGKPLAP